MLRTKHQAFFPLGLSTRPFTACCARAGTPPESPNSPDTEISPCVEKKIFRSWRWRRRRLRRSLTPPLPPPSSLFFPYFFFPFSTYIHLSFLFFAGARVVLVCQ